MSIEDNKQVVRTFYEEVVNNRNMDLGDEIIVEDYIHHDPSLPPDVQRGRENYKRGFAIFTQAFPDLHGTIEALIAEGDLVTSRITWRGTHNGDLMGIAPTGKKVAFSFLSTQKVQNGKLVEGWVSFDALGMMQQIGAIPTPEPAGARA